MVRTSWDVSVGGDVEPRKLGTYFEKKGLVAGRAVHICLCSLELDEADLEINLQFQRTTQSC